MINTTSYMYPQVNGTFQFLFYTYQTPTVAELCCWGVDKCMSFWPVHWILYKIGKHFKQFRKQSASFNTKSNHDPCVNSEKELLGFITTRLMMIDWPSDNKNCKKNTISYQKR